MKNSILLIDDDKRYSQFCKKALEKDGYQVKCLHSPEAASDETHCHSKYSHVLVDFEYRNSKITGEEIGRQFRWKWPLLARVLMTAYMHEESARGRFIRVGWDAAFEKETQGVPGSEIRNRLVQVLRAAEVNAQNRIQEEFPISDEDCDQTLNRLEALEKACRANAGKKMGGYDNKELVQAACIFLSTGRDELNAEDIADLQGLRGNPKSKDRQVWVKKNIRMISPNAWSQFFQIRSAPQRGERFGVGKLMVEVLTFLRSTRVSVL